MLRDDADDAPMRTMGTMGARGARPGVVRAARSGGAPRCRASGRGSETPSRARLRVRRAGPARARSNGSGGGGAEGLRDLPTRAVDLTTTQRDALGQLAPLRLATWGEGALRRPLRCRGAACQWPGGRPPWTSGGGTGEAMLWRLLRIGSAPYFVLGSSAERSLRLRIATSWDWRQQFQLISIQLDPQRGGQPRVGWLAVVRDRQHPRGQRGGRSHRGALEPWSLRRTCPRPRGISTPRTTWCRATSPLR